MKKLKLIDFDNVLNPKIKFDIDIVCDVYDIFLKCKETLKFIVEELSKYIIFSKSGEIKGISLTEEEISEAKILNRILDMHYKMYMVVFLISYINSGEVQKTENPSFKFNYNNKIANSIISYFKKLKTWLPMKVVCINDKTKPTKTQEIKIFQDNSFTLLESKNQMKESSVIANFLKLIDYIEYIKNGDKTQSFSTRKIFNIYTKSIELWNWFNNLLVNIGDDSYKLLLPNHNEDDKNSYIDKVKIFQIEYINN